MREQIDAITEGLLERRQTTINEAAKSYKISNEKDIVKTVIQMCKDYEVDPFRICNRIEIEVKRAGKFRVYVQDKKGNTSFYMPFKSLNDLLNDLNDPSTRDTSDAIFTILKRHISGSSSYFLQYQGELKDGYLFSLGAGHNIKVERN